MANVNNAHGLGFVLRIGGGPEWCRRFQKLAAYGVALFINDVVLQVAGDSVQGAILQAWTDIATPGTTNPSGVCLNFGALSTLTEHFINVDPYTVWECQDNAASHGLRLQDIGLNANLTQDAGSTTTKLAGIQVSESSFNVSGSRDVHMLGVYPEPNNAAGNNCRIEITWNHHRMFPATVGV